MRRRGCSLWACVALVVTLVGSGVFGPARARADETSWRQFRGRVVVSDYFIAPAASFPSSEAMVAALRRLERATIEASAGFWRLHLYAFLDRVPDGDGLRLLTIDVTDAREPREVRAFDLKAARRGEGAAARRLRADRGHGVRQGAPLRDRGRARARRQRQARQRKSRRLRQRGDNPEVGDIDRPRAGKRPKPPRAKPRVARYGCARRSCRRVRVGRGCGRSGGASSRSSRRTNPRTGRMTPAQSELVKAHKRGDRAALARVADRMGLVRLGEAIASTEPGVGEAALSAAPLARGGVLLIGAATEQIATSDWARAAAAAGALGALLDGSVPSGIEEWDVPADVWRARARRCARWRGDRTRRWRRGWRRWTPSRPRRRPAAGAPTWRRWRATTCPPCGARR